MRFRKSLNVVDAPRRLTFSICCYPRPKRLVTFTSHSSRRSCAHRVLRRARLCAQPELTRLRLARVVYRRVLFGDSDGGFARGAKWQR